LAKDDSQQSFHLPQFFFQDPLRLTSKTCSIILYEHAAYSPNNMQHVEVSRCSMFSTHPLSCAFRASSSLFFMTGMEKLDILLSKLLAAI